MSEWIGTKDTVIEESRVTVGGVVVTVRAFTRPGGKTRIYASAGNGWKRLTS